MTTGTGKRIAAVGAVALGSWIFFDKYVQETKKESPLLRSLLVELSKKDQITSALGLPLHYPSQSYFWWLCPVKRTFGRITGDVFRGEEPMASGNVNNGIGLKGERTVTATGNVCGALGKCAEWQVEGRKVGFDWDIKRISVDIGGQKIIYEY